MSLVALHCQALTSIEPALFERSKRGVNKKITDIVAKWTFFYPLNLWRGCL
jgi:hypothetical protein